MVPGKDRNRGVPGTIHHNVQPQQRTPETVNVRQRRGDTPVMRQGDQDTEAHTAL